MEKMTDGIILWEAHRAGAGGHELPESCLAAFEYGWSLGGRPEADVNVTSDGVMDNKICGCARKIVKNSDISVLRMAHLYPKCYELKDFGNPVNAYSL